MSNRLSDQLFYLTEYVHLPDVFGEGASTETHQVGMINSDHKFTIAAKSRRIGFSVGSAMRSYAKAATIDGHESIFISISQQEASEKIRIVDKLHQATLKKYRPVKITDNKTTIEFANGSRIISLPCKATRGFGEADIYLDEFAFYPNDLAVYEGTIASLARSGQLHLGSSVCGAQGLFWEIFTEAFKRYPGYQRRMLPWWASEGLCVDIYDAMQKAPLMRTHDRVDRYGTSSLKFLFNELPLMSFQQEFECAWQDASIAWLSWDEIKSNQEWDMSDRLYFEYVEPEPHRTIDEFKVAIDDLAHWSQEMSHPPMFAGYDVGRRRHLSELTVISYESPPYTPYRLGISLDQAPFDLQQAVISYALDKLPIEGMFIDSTGLGMQLGEYFEDEYPYACMALNFSNDLKQTMAVGTKLQFQRGHSPIPVDRDLGNQLHSIQRKISGSNNMIFDADKNSKHHADRFWSLSMAQHAINEFEGTSEGETVGAGHRG